MKKILLSLLAVNLAMPMISKVNKTEKSHISFGRSYNQKQEVTASASQTKHSKPSLFTRVKAKVKSTGSTIAKGAKAAGSKITQKASAAKTAIKKKFEGKRQHNNRAYNEMWNEYEI